MQFDERLRQIMAGRKVTKNKVSEDCNIGYATITSICDGKTKSPGLDILCKLAQYFNMTVSELIGEKEERYSSKVKELADMAVQLNPTQLESLIFTAKAFLKVYSEMAATALKREKSMEISYT